MLSDKPKLIFTNIAGKVTLETRLHVPIENRNSSSWFHEETRTSYQQIKQAEKPTPEQQYLKALYNVGETTQ